MQRLSRRKVLPITQELASLLSERPRKRRRAANGLSRSLRCPEPLEPRCLLATFIVNHVGDAPDFNLGDGIVDSDAGTPGQQITLRAAIQNANLDAAVDNIDFNIAGAGVKTISPTSGLPTISQPVVINGYTQPNAAANTRGVGSNATILIQLDGLSAGLASSGLTISAGGSTVRGLSITRFAIEGIFILGPGNFSTIAGNFLGVPPSGNVDQGNGRSGVQIDNSAGNVIGGVANGDRNVISGNNDSGVGLVGTNSTNNIIEGNYIGTNSAGAGDIGNASDGITITQRNTGGGIASHTFIGGTLPGLGNVISGNDLSGIAFVGAGAGFNVVEGNRIGVNAAGTAALGNALHGVLNTLAGGIFGNMSSPSNTIGGTTLGARNIISGNGRAGVAMFGVGATGNKVQGNYIGTDVSGTLAFPNANDGVRLGGNDAIGSGPSGNYIGGTEPGAGNLISGNMDNGIEIAGATTSGNRIEGNLIGTIVGGSGARPNERMGVRIEGATNTIIGGTTPAARNVISGNGLSGIQIGLSTATGNRVEGNYIGVTADAVAGLANQGSGVYITSDASGNMVGGSTPSAGNLIAYNIGDGVTITSGNRNTVRLNSIRNNNDLGIDLNFDDETLNDQNDADSGPNDLQNWPEITNFSFDEVVPLPRATGFFEGKNNTTYTLDFYANSGFAPSSLGEGAEYLSTEMLTTDSNGYVQFSYLIPLALPLGKFLTVTATDPDGNTSEFSHDADTDGLYDRWESAAGVDGDNDGAADFFLNNPNPMHKDVYVEVDAMGLIKPAAAGSDVVDAFASRPSAASMLNPDGQPGISLHFELDPNNIFQQPVTTMGELRAVKTANFGTRAELINPNFAAILAAKRMTHRYAVYAPPDLGTDSEPGAGGRSWLLSHEFYLSLGQGSQENLAAVFMHELGHALNLGHGGGDGVNYKPNYHSLMNYMWSYHETDNPDFGDSWSLDYSATRFFTLDENFLVEAAGIGGDPSHTTKAGPLPAEFVLEAGPIDWNRDGDTTDVITTGININKLVADDAGVDTILTGHDDWSHLTLNFHHSQQYREEFGLETGASAPAAGGNGAKADLPPDIIAELRDIGFTNKAVRIQGLPDVYANPGDVINFAVPAADPEGNALSFSLAPGAPAGASVHPTTGQFTWATSAAADYGEFIITVRVVDAGSGRPREQRYGFAILGPSGDFDENSDVDGADLLAWQRGLGTPQATLAIGDADDDDDVDHNDLDVWKRQFGPVVLMGAAAPTLVASEVAADAPAPDALLLDGEALVDAAMAAAFASLVEAPRRTISLRHSLPTEIVSPVPSEMRRSIDDDDADLAIAGDNRIENGVDEAHFRGPLSDPFESLSGVLRRHRASAFARQSS